MVSEVQAKSTAVLISALMCAVACLLLRTGYPVNLEAGTIVDYRPLIDTKYASTIAMVALVEFAVFTPIIIIASYAIHVGVEETMSYLGVACLNLGATPGCFLPGIMGDRVCRFNMTVLTMLVCALMTLGLWLCISDNLAAITCHAVLFGF